MSAFMRGRIVRSAGGCLQAVIGGEWRDEAVIHGDLTQPVDDGRQVKAAFAELSVPLISSTPHSMAMCSR